MASRASTPGAIKIPAYRWHAVATKWQPYGFCSSRNRTSFWHTIPTKLLTHQLQFVAQDVRIPEQHRAISQTVLRWTPSEVSQFPRGSGVSRQIFAIRLDTNTAHDIHELESQVGSFPIVALKPKHSGPNSTQPYKRRRRQSISINTRTTNLPPSNSYCSP